MAFCSKCGAPLGEGMKFCGTCGNQTGGTVVQVMERPQAQAGISQMDRQSLLKTFTEADRVLTAYEACRETAKQTREDEEGKEIGKWDVHNLASLSRENTKERLAREKILKKQHPKEYKLLTYSTWATLGLLLLSVVLFFALHGSVVPFLFPAIGFVIMFYALNQWQQITKNYSDMVVGQSDVVQEKEKRVVEALAVCEQSLALLSIPPAYRYTYAMEQMARFVENLLADSWKECAVLYEDHMHKLRMEAHAEETKELAELSAFYAKQAASNARAAAIFSGLNFFFG